MEGYHGKFTMGGLLWKVTMGSSTWEVTVGGLSWEVYNTIHKAAGLTVPSRSMILPGTIPETPINCEWSQWGLTVEC